MRIEHVAIWTQNLDRSKNFYETYFQATAGQKYENPKKGFASYFLTFQSGARLEIMFILSLADVSKDNEKPSIGYAHIAISVGSKEMVDEITQLLKQDGFLLIDEPRTTGDGYYESVVLDPDGNKIEITI